MDTQQTIVRLAEIAHDLWRERLELEGWSHGPRYDEASRRHDALVPFSELDPRDRRQAILGIRAMDLLNDLADSVWYERGPARLFDAAEMREGFGVGWNTEHCEPGPDAPPEPGRVVAWEVDEEGMLCSITIVWADGSTSEHLPEARELRRLAQAPRPPQPDPPM